MYAPTIARTVWPGGLCIHYTDITRILCGYYTDGSVYAMAQASKAILPRDVGGPWGKRIKVAVGGELSWALRVTAFVTGRVNPSDWLRYSLVVLNCEDTTNVTPLSLY